MRDITRTSGRSYFAVLRIGWLEYLAGGARTVNIPLLMPNRLFEGRIRRLDLRLSKGFQLPKRTRLQVNLDAYNALNSSAIQALNNTYGASWLKPTQILDPRILQISCQLAF